MRSFEDSLQRMALERIDIAFIHDIDNFSHPPDVQKAHFRTAMNGAYRALDKLRSEGLVKAIGVGCNEWQVCDQALRERDFDCFLLAGRYTLLEQEALDAFLPFCEQRNVAIALGGGYNSGILATGAVKGAHYNYSPAPEPILAHVRSIEAVPRSFRVALKAAALQFVLAHPCLPHDHSRHTEPRASRGQSQAIWSPDSGRLLGRAQAQGTATRGCANSRNMMHARLVSSRSALH